MQTGTFLIESLTSEQFPLLTQYWTKNDSDRSVKRIARVVAVLNQYESGPIPNAEFIAVKDDVNRLIDYSYFGVLDNVSDESMTRIRQNWSNYAGIDDYNTSTPAHIPGKLKKAEAEAKKWANNASAKADVYTEFFGNVIPKMKELLPLVAAIESLKGRAVKRQPKEKDTPASLRAKYVAPMASKESGKLVVDALTELSDKLKVTYATWIFEDSMRRAKEFASKDAQGQHDSQNSFSDLMSIHDAWDESTLKRGWNTGEDVIGKDYNGRPRKGKWHVYKLASGHEAAFKKAADQAAQSMQDQFVVKNAQKLDSIVDRKAKQSTLKEAPRPIGKLDVSARGTISGDLQFTFEDGSGFRVRNKVVWKSRYTNSYGAQDKYTHFVQFPTTFHDVTLPDGSAMSQPSEERMNTVFAVV